MAFSIDLYAPCQDRLVKQYGRKEEINSKKLRKEEKKGICEGKNDIYAVKKLRTQKKISEKKI